MGHHLHAVPPPIIQLAPKPEKPRWRPRIRAAAPQAGEAPGAREGEEVFASGDPSDETPRRRTRAGRGKDVPAAQRRGGPAAQPLTEETLRTLLIGQEDALNRAG
jgi:hypothetical protein